MKETTGDKVWRYREEFPQDNGRWYRGPIENTCSGCGCIIDNDTIYVRTRSAKKSNYICEFCVFGTDLPSSPEYTEHVEQPIKQPDPPTPPKPVAATWIINSNGICYHCNVSDCVHTRRKR